MPDNFVESSQGPHQAAGGAPPLSFREFLRTKADEFGVRDRHRRRVEWLGSLHGLLDLIRDWLRQSDPEGLLDIEPYEITRTEPELGTYEAPALRIHLGAVEVDVTPVGREVPFPAHRDRGASGTSTEFAGRVDLTDGLRKYNLYREVRDGKDHWQVRDEHNQFTDLDREGFERILQDLLS